MNSNDIRKVKKTAYALIKFGGYLLDFLMIVETFSGFRGKVKFQKKQKFKVPRRKI